jgi:hypothetical protein
MTFTRTNIVVKSLVPPLFLSYPIAVRNRLI